MDSVDNLTPKDIVATFPGAKATVKRLMKECEDFLEEVRIYEQETKEFLSSRVNMYDIDICTSLVLAAAYGGEIEKANEKLKRLTRLWYLYEPPTGPTPGLITEEEIARAKEYPIKELVAVRGKMTKCLWHNDSHPSLYIYPDNHGFCFSCKKYADAIDFAMALQNISFVSAVKWLTHL